jgi:hypothetical protein
MRYRTLAWAWAAEIWVNLTTEPWRRLPHFCQPAWRAQGGEYACRWCGSASARVQRKGIMQGEILRRRLS